MKPHVYLETSVISYLAARPNRDLIVAAHQQVTHEWWTSRRADFRLVTSRYVFEESSQGDPTAAQERLAYLQLCPALTDTPAVEALARKLVARGALPPKAFLDALHVAAAAVAGVEYLLTWNCKHIANVEILPLIESVCRSEKLSSPRISTPLELLGN